LADPKFKTSHFILYNQNYQSIVKQELTKSEYQILVETQNIAAGFYLCKLYKNGVEISSKPITIKPDQITTEQLENYNVNENIISNQLMIVYPNPAKDNFTIAFSDLQFENDKTNKKISITDNSGKIVFEQILEKNSTRITINCSNFAKGIYSINMIENNKITETQSIVIK